VSAGAPVVALFIALATAAGGAAGEVIPAARQERDLNPFVLSSLVSRELVVEIDWIEGYRPSRLAVDAAEAPLQEHCDPGKSVQVHIDDAIPLREWQKIARRDQVPDLVARRLGRDPRNWQRTEVLYVLYVPTQPAGYPEHASGFTERIVFETDEGAATVSTVVLFTDEIRADASWSVGVARIERSTLVHEIGHVFGLVTNPEHVQPGQPGHCDATGCVMHQPRARARWRRGVPALFGRIPRRLDKRCRADIAAAKARWNELAGESKDYVERLVARRLLQERAASERPPRDVATP
jgi:hypothetical protein